MVNTKQLLINDIPKYIWTTLIQPGFPDSSVGKESACNAEDSSSIPRSGRSTGKAIGNPFQYSRASLVIQLVKNPPAMRETWVRSLGWEDSPGEGKSYPLQYSGLENSTDCIVHADAKSRTQLQLSLNTASLNNKRIKEYWWKTITLV